MSAWLYVLRCRDGSLYTGWTNGLERRGQTHQMGRGGKYTRSRLPVCLIAAWKKRSAREARRAEGFFKQLTRDEKMVKIGKWEQTKAAARIRLRTAAFVD